MRKRYVFYLIDAQITPAKPRLSASKITPRNCEAISGTKSWKFCIAKFLRVPTRLPKLLKRILAYIAESGVFRKSQTLARGVSLLIILNFCSILFCFSQENITLTTYYPAPFGVYLRLSANTLGVGDTDGSGVIDVADAPDPTANPGDVWITGDVGIGTTNPQSRLDVLGSVAIGATYAGTNAAPTDGLLVQGDMGIGTTTPNFTAGSDLVINNTLLLTPRAGDPEASFDPPEPVFDKAVYYDTIGRQLVFQDGEGWKQVSHFLLFPPQPISPPDPKSVFFDVSKTHYLVYRTDSGWKTIGHPDPVIPPSGGQHMDRQPVSYDAASESLVYHTSAGWRAISNHDSSAALVLPNTDFEDAIYYNSNNDTGKHLFKYHDGLGWKEISGVQWGDCVEKRSNEQYGNDAAVVNCDEGYAAVEVFLIANKSCNKNGCKTVEIPKIGLRCRKIL